MCNKLCDRNCECLNLTESEQKALGSKKPHFCMKHDRQLKHLDKHPDLYQCEECINEDQSNERN